MGRQPRTWPDESDLHLARPAWFRWAAVAGWMGLIFFFSDQPGLMLSPDAWWSDWLSWLAHFIEYAVLAVLLRWALHSAPPLARWAAPLALVLSVLYAISDEYHQSFVPGRQPDVRDVMVDAAGALVALWLVHRYLNRR